MHSCYILNRAYHKTSKQILYYEAWREHKPDLKHKQMFGNPVTIKKPVTGHQKDTPMSTMVASSYNLQEQQRTLYYTVVLTWEPTKWPLTGSMMNSVQ